MLLEIEHKIHFDYSDFINESWMELRVEPKATPEQTLRSYFLAIGPPSTVNAFTDWLGNVVHTFSIAKFHNRIEILSRSIVDIHRPEYDPSAFAVYPEAVDGPERDMLLFGGPIENSEALQAFNAKIPQKAETIGDMIQEISEAMKSELKYLPNVTQYDSSIDHALEIKAGVCQDFAQIMIGVLRLRGIPARYVNGYLHVEKTDVAESHAWVEFWVPGRGWCAFDPTNHIYPTNHHVVVAVGRNYDDVPPNKGVFRGFASETLTAEVRTRVITEDEVRPMRDQLGSIEVPVYTKVPARATTSLQGQVVEQAQQQQQQ
ncbi:MAG: transglutaminase family protein [Fimbriimonadaceae bacterium]|nr:transglutaminase family protein [Fimbriimonadaceae bacterium]